MKTIINIKKIISLMYSIDRKPIIMEIICVFAENTERILRILLPAVIIRLITDNRFNISMICVLIAVSLISVFGFASKITRSLLSPYAFRTDNLIAGKIREKLFRLDFEYSEAEEHLERYNLVKSTFYKFLEVDYLIINECFGSVLIFAAMSVFISRISPILYAAVLAAALINYRLSRNCAEKIYKTENKKKSAYARKNYFTELLYDVEASKEIKLYEAQDYIMDMYAGAAGEIRNFNEETERYTCLLNMKKHLLAFFQRIAVYFYAIYEFAGKDLRLGSFYILISAGTEFVSSVENIVNSINKIREVSMYFNDYDEYVNLDERMYSGGNVPVEKIETVEFQNVSFSYNNTGKNVLEDINCKINTGDRIALIGENGAGKTTFVKLLLRMYDPTSGKILVNGRDIREYDYGDYLKKFSCVFQDSRLTGYSLLENIIIDKGCDCEKLNRICETVGIAERIKEEDKGFDSIVSKDLSDDGILFSGGERQKIAIARALYKNDKNIVLDEPASALDAISERNLFENISELSSDGMMIYITHRLSNVAFCNNILLFEDGKISENGSHDELIRRNGKYADMFRKQAGFYLGGNI